MSILSLVFLAVVASIITFVLSKIRKDRELQNDLLRMEAELNELLDDGSTTELEMDLWEARNFSRIEHLESEGQASSLVYKLRHFHVA